MRCALVCCVLAMAMLTACERPKSNARGHDDHSPASTPGSPGKPDAHADHGHRDLGAVSSPKLQSHTGHESGDHDEPLEGTVQLSTVAIERSGIVVETAAHGTLEGIVEIPAEVQLNPDRVAHISPLVEGQISRVDVSLGDTVQAGQTLAELRSIALGQARAELRRTVAFVSVARKTLDRQERLRSEGINSERSLLEAQLALDEAQAERESAQTRLRVFGIRGGSGPDMDLISPIAGTIVERHATRGEAVSPKEPIFVVADLQRVWVIGRVYEQQIASVGLGMRAVLTLTAHPSRAWEGKVDYIGVAIDPATRTLPIRVEFDNSSGILRPGLFGTLRLSADARGSAGVLVPSAAVQLMDGRLVVFVPTEKPGQFMRRYVTVGRESQGRVEIIEGLAPGESFVVAGGFVLKSELMRGQLGHGHAH